MQNGQLQPKYTRRMGDPNRHVITKLPPRQIVIKGTGKILFFEQQPLQSYRTSKCKQCQENNKSLQLQGDTTILQHHRQQMSLAPGYTTAINSGDAPHVAPIQMSSNKSQVSDTMSKKIIPATAAKKIVILP